MWIGLGIFLIVAGAIIKFALTEQIPGVADGPLGWILIAAGVLAIVLSFIVQAQRQRTRHEVVRDERVDHEIH